MGGHPLPTRTLTRSRRKWKTKRKGALTCRECALAIWNYTVPYRQTACCLATNKRRSACKWFTRPVKGISLPEHPYLRTIEVLFPPR